MRPYFKSVFFVTRKTKTLFQEIAEVDTEVAVIGDRFEDEIKLGIELGFITIQVEPNNNDSSKFKQPTHTVSSIKKGIEIVKSYEY